MRKGEIHLLKFAFVICLCSLILHSNTIGYDLSDLTSMEYEMPVEVEPDAESKNLDKLKKDKYIPSISFHAFQQEEMVRPSDRGLITEFQVIICIPTPPPESC